jgi:hypothetical protein
MALAKAPALPPHRFPLPPSCSHFFEPKMSASTGASPVVDSDPYTHVTLSVASGARVYILRPVSASSTAVSFEIRLQTWNGLPYKQSQGIRLIAESASALINNALHWIGSQCPYGAASEELESRQAVRIARYGNDSHAAVEEAFSMIGKLSHPEGGE